MIFVTVGMQLPFDRLIRAVDEIAPEVGEEIIAQTQRSVYMPRHIKTIDYLSSIEYSDLMRRARLIISHAGAGTIISALMLKKPIIIMPRRVSLGEHRSDHQMEFSKRMNELHYVHVAYDDRQLQALVLDSRIRYLKELGTTGLYSLISSLRNFILNTE